MAQAYLALGLTELAQRLLHRLAPEFSFLDELWILHASLHPVYWDALATLAFELKDSKLRLKCTEKTFAFTPQSWVARNNYAAALVIHHTRPEEAIQHTFSLLSQQPAVATLVIKHALALDSFLG